MPSQPMKLQAQPQCQAIQRHISPSSIHFPIIQIIQKLYITSNSLTMTKSWSLPGLISDNSHHREPEREALLADQDIENQDPAQSTTSLRRLEPRPTMSIPTAASEDDGEEAESLWICQRTACVGSKRAAVALTIVLLGGIGLGFLFAWLLWGLVKT
jgi:hypothetical protein